MAGEESCRAGTQPRSTLQSQGPITIKAATILLTLPHIDSWAGGGTASKHFQAKKGLKKKKKRKIQTHLGKNNHDIRSRLEGELKLQDGKQISK